jgi:cellulose synthase/poly-beta-1,6-N-acetylglucosamine synthase-like glycosyltransferase
MIFAVTGWSLYNMPILVAGIRNLRARRLKVSNRNLDKKSSPFFSLVVPVRDEEKVVGRLISSLSKLDYPAEKMEIIFVEDASTDKTFHICEEEAKRLGVNVKIFHRESYDGKPSALNYGIACAKGDIIGVFDADSVIERDVLLNVCKYFEDPKVAAVQGRTLSINSHENMLTKVISYEDAVWFEAYLRGKDALDLFVHLKGSCQFIRRNVLDKVQGFAEGFLAEDMELSAKLTEKGYQIRYAPDVRSWQENPSNVKQLFGQRIRWYRGWMEVAFKYGRLMAKPNRMGVDAEATLLGPFILIFSLVTYLATILAFFIPPGLDIFWQLAMQFTAVGTTLLVGSCGLALIYISKPRNLKNLLWLPFIFSYWSLQAFLALYAGFQILLRRPRRWLKTEKKGVVANPEFFSSPEKTAELNVEE